MELPNDPAHMGLLRDSAALLNSPAGLRRQIAEDGYLFLRGALDRDEVLQARRAVTDRLLAGGCLQPGSDPMEAIASTTYNKTLMTDLAANNEPLHRVLYAGRMMSLFEQLLEGPVRHFDYTWFRAVAPGKGTAPHCDSVYMNRGTKRLFTAWTPIGDCPYKMGGLMILDGSHNNQRLRRTYCKTDVDSYCVNRSGHAAMDAWDRGNNGILSHNPVQLQRSLNGRWLTEEFRAGDVLIFSIFTVHASLDNHSRCIRLSTDSRYQRADEPIDERWIGEKPIAHSKSGKRGRVC